MFTTVVVGLACVELQGLIVLHALRAYRNAPFQDYYGRRRVLTLVMQMISELIVERKYVDFDSIEYILDLSNGLDFSQKHSSFYRQRSTSVYLWGPY